MLNRYWMDRVSKRTPPSLRLTESYKPMVPICALRGAYKWGWMARVWPRIVRVFNDVEGENRRDTRTLGLPVFCSPTDAVRSSSAGPAITVGYDMSHLCLGLSGIPKKRFPLPRLKLYRHLLRVVYAGLSELARRGRPPTSPPNDALLESR